MPRSRKPKPFKIDGPIKHATFADVVREFNLPKRTVDDIVRFLTKPEKRTRRAA